jgi:hypothetical protein
MEAHCDSNCPGCIKCQNSTTGNNINIMTDFNQYLPKRPSALVTIGSVLKALIDNGILKEDGLGGYCLTKLGYEFCNNYLNDREYDGMKQSLQLKLEVEV